MVRFTFSLLSGLNAVWIVHSLLDFVDSDCPFQVILLDVPPVPIIPNWRPTVHS